MEKSRFIVGLILVAAAVLIYLFAEGTFSTGGAIAILVLGLVSIATARRK